MPPLARAVGRWAAYVLGALVALCAIGALMFAAFQRSLIYHPTRAGAPHIPPRVAAAGLARRWLPTPAGDVELWLMPGQGVSAAHPGPVVLFAHGNAELIDHWPERLLPYHRLGVSVCLVEYRGYGRSAGSPSQAAITADFVAAFDLLTTHPLVDPRRIVFHGRSLGGGVVMALVAQRPPAALVLESTFASLVAMAQGMGVPAWLGRWLVRDPYDSEATLRGYGGPTLIFHGEHDEVIPFAHGQRLHSARPGSRLIAMPCGHNDLPRDPRAYWLAITDHLRAAEIIQP